MQVRLASPKDFGREKAQKTQNGIGSFATQRLEIARFRKDFSRGKCRPFIDIRLAGGRMRGCFLALAKDDIPVNPNLESRNPKQIRISNDPNPEPTG
ncbi:MAG: hypothetical protein JXQ71_07620 [Verrucomicrobia bacterium]|nr:hypothetical protein [Verrucomicrobiota bacterium]